jgi:C4-dicarboxylate-specific signal transduction histidine kinase
MATLSLLCCGATAYLRTQRLLDSTNWVSHNQEVLSSLERLGARLDRAESCKRSYMLQQDPSYLLCFQDASSQVSGELKHLRSLAGSDPSQNDNLNRLEPIVHRRLQVLQEGIAVHDQHGFQPARQFALLQQRMATQEQMRAEMNVIEKAEQDLLTSRLLTARQTAQRTVLLLGAGAFLSVSLLWFVFFKLKYEIDRRVSAQYYLRLAYAALDVGNRHLNGILESTPDSIGAVDQQLQWIAFNGKYSSEFEARYGNTPETGMRVDEALAQHPQELGAAVALWQRALAGETFTITENCSDPARGDRFHEVRYYPITDRCGTPIAACHITRDISERKRFENLLLRQSEELQRSNAELEQFAYVASHDLQEPLRMVASYMQLLAERYRGKLDAKADKYIAYAVDGAQRMQSLINDLLALSRVNSRGAEFRTVDCESVLDQVLHDLAMAIRDSNAIVERGPLPTLLGDERQIGQLFQNLIGNALKFRADRPPHIRVHTERQQNQWLFRVQDNGIGIAPEHSERIFILFQRLHSRQKYSGTGIGLAICRKIVERHGGRIWVESEPGHGATFHFTLPVAPITETHTDWQEAAATCA